MKSKRADFDQVIHELEAAGLSPELLSRGESHEEFIGITSDSRRLGPNDIFCAIKGSKFDGHDLVAEALQVSKLAIVERSIENIKQTSSSIIKVNSTRAAWAQLSSFFADHPTKKLTMIGITGTNGKTSTTWLLKEIFGAIGIKSGSIGTLGFFVGEEHVESAHTTPDPDVLYPVLASFVTKGITHVVMEVSSHSLVQGKVWPIFFDACAFTSFSQDHLDFHSSMEEYLGAKLSLFKRQLKDGATALIHKSILAWPSAKMFFSSLSHGVVTYGSKDSSCDFQIKSESYYKQGFSRLTITSENSDRAEATLPMVGDVFCENFAAALILASRISTKNIASLSQLIRSQRIRPVPGRLELVQSTTKPWRPPVYVDYAHTPDALEKAIINLSTKPRSIYTVFGCGGDRDKKKRPVMGEIASKLSKKVFITSDNPRTEDPGAIIADILRGIADPSNTVVEADRHAAISRAIGECTGATPILIAGKGHEAYQIIGDRTLAFSDQKEALASLNKPKAWLIVGAGVTGQAAAQILVAANETVFMYADSAFQLSVEIASKVVSVSQDKIDWSLIDIVVVSPGIAGDHPVAASARSFSKEIITEIDLGLDRYRGSIVAVTGTNGKSTTVAMTEFLLQAKDIPADACGNIGIPPTSIPLFLKSDRHCAIIELSSYQLDGAASWPAKAAAVTSFSYDHLTRHKTMEGYFSAKWNICEWLGADSIFIVSQEVAEFATRFDQKWPACRTIVVSRENNPQGLPNHVEIAHIHDGQLSFGNWRLDFEQIGVRGEHNHLNAFVAMMLAAHVSGINAQTFAPLLRQYKGLPYRCETIFDNGERIIVNDSKSTNLESTLAALSLAIRPAILLMGGQGKGESYQDLSKAKNKIATLIAFGFSAGEIARDSPTGVCVEQYEKMAPAVLRAINLARDNKWDIIFSPGCASFDEFKNFEHRGAVFTQMVRDAE